MELNDILALFRAEEDEDGERTQAAVDLFLDIRDYPEDDWIIPDLGEGHDALQYDIAKTIARQYGRRMVWPDNGEGSCHLLPIAG